jgi:hypothetical protein
MDEIHIARGSERLGLFSLEQVRAGLKSGEFLPADLGWKAGMLSWTQLSAWDDFGGAGVSPETTGESRPTLRLAGQAESKPPTSAAAAPAGAASAPPAPLGPISQAGNETVEESGLPWENRGSDFFGALMETVKLVLLRPSEAFTLMRREGGIVDPLSFVVIAGSVGILFATFYTIALEFLIPGLVQPMQPHPATANAIPKFLGAAFAIPLIPVFVVLASFIGAAVTHGCLLLVGGATRGYETTFRVFSFSYGATTLLQVVPFCGGIVAGVWYLVAAIIGLSKAHEIPAWKAAAAIFLPIFICCGALVALAITVFGSLSAISH